MLASLFVFLAELAGAKWRAQAPWCSSQTHTPPGALIVRRRVGNPKRVASKFLNGGLLIYRGCLKVGRPFLARSPTRAPSSWSLFWTPPSQPPGMLVALLVLTELAAANFQGVGQASSGPQPPPLPVRGEEEWMGESPETPSPLAPPPFRGGHESLGIFTCKRVPYIFPYIFSHVPAPLRLQIGSRPESRRLAETALKIVARCPPPPPHAAQPSHPTQ